jgi:hypothetical protein
MHAERALRDSYHSSFTFGKEGRGMLTVAGGLVD